MSVKSLYAWQVFLFDFSLKLTVFRNEYQVKQTVKSELFLITSWDLFNVKQKVGIVRQKFLLKRRRYSFAYIS